MKSKGSLRAFLLFAVAIAQKWVPQAVPTDTLKFIRALNPSKPVNVNQRDEEAVALFAGVWDEVSTPEEVIKAYNLNLLKMNPITDSWSEILKFIESGQADVVYRVLERREPVQEIHIADDGCIKDPTCPVEMNVSVWFTSKEKRDSTFTIGDRTTFSSDETGTHDVITNLLSSSDVSSLVQASKNVEKKQKHEHLRIVFPETSDTPRVMLYRWVVHKQNGKSLELVKWYSKSSLSSYISRKVEPLPSRFTTDGSLLFDSKYATESTDNATTIPTTPTMKPYPVRFIKPRPSEMVATSTTSSTKGDDDEIHILENIQGTTESAEASNEDIVVNSYVADDYPIDLRHVWSATNLTAFEEDDEVTKTTATFDHTDQVSRPFLERPRITDFFDGIRAKSENGIRIRDRLHARLHRRNASDE